MLTQLGATYKVIELDVESEYGYFINFILEIVGLCLLLNGAECFQSIYFCLCVIFLIVFSVEDLVNTST